jgi:pyruvate formate-lyase activating enzyme
VSQFKNIERVDILPFHQMGTYKWENLGKDYKLKDVKTPTREEVEKAEGIFKSYGLKLLEK